MAGTKNSIGRTSFKSDGCFKEYYGGGGVRVSFRVGPAKPSKRSRLELFSAISEILTSVPSAGSHLPLCPCEKHANKGKAPGTRGRTRQD